MSKVLCCTDGNVSTLYKNLFVFRMLQQIVIPFITESIHWCATRCDLHSNDSSDHNAILITKHCPLHEIIYNLRIGHIIVTGDVLSIKNIFNVVN